HPFPNGFPDALAVALAIAALGDLPDLRGGVVALVVLGVAATTTLDGRTPRVAVAATAPLVHLVVGLVALAGLAPARLAPVVLAVGAGLGLHPRALIAVLVVALLVAILVVAVLVAILVVAILVIAGVGGSPLAILVGFLVRLVAVLAGLLLLLVLFLVLLLGLVLLLILLLGLVLLLVLLLVFLLGLLLLLEFGRA